MYGRCMEFHVRASPLPVPALYEDVGESHTVRSWLCKCIGRISGADRDPGGVLATNQTLQLPDGSVLVLIDLSEGLQGH